MSSHLMRSVCNAATNIALPESQLTPIVGSPAELAQAFLEYKRIGVTQFIISGWPKLDEMKIFGREVLPLVRQAEHSTNGR